MTLRRVNLLAGAGVLVLLVALVLLARSCGGGSEPPATGAVELLPETTLVAITFSLDGDREANAQAGELLDRFGFYKRQRDQILQRLSGGTQAVDLERDVEPWLGDEAAFALLDAGTATAGSLIVVGVTDEQKARAFLDRNPRRPTFREYKEERIAQYGTVNVAFKGDYLLIGQERSVQAGLDRANGRGSSLDEVDAFRRATRERPEGRVVDAYASAGGLRRLLVPQGGLVGGLATLLDQPALQAVSLSAEPTEGGVRVVSRSALDPKVRRTPLRAFEPDLIDAVPEDALAYFGVRGISDALGRLVGAAAGGANAGGVGPILDGLRRQLDRESGGRLERDLLALLRQEVALVITRATPAPILSLVTKTSDEQGTRETLRRLQAPLARLLTPKGEQAPRWRAQDFGGGARGATLATPAGPSLSYSVAEGRLVVSTSTDGVRRIQGAEGSIQEAEGFEEVLGDRPETVGSLGFLDFSQLLELGEQTGLNDSPAYLAARADLQKIRAVGVNSTGSEGETTAEILLSIP